MILFLGLFLRGGDGCFNRENLQNGIIEEC